MNTHTWLMGTKKAILGLLAISALGIVALPARAQNAVIQESVQEAVNTGDGNASLQNTDQESRINRRTRSRRRNSESTDTGIVQRNDQFCDQLGEENVCVQNTEQRSRLRNRRSR